MRPRENFCSDFELLTGHGPFPWQQKLFDEFLEQRFPEACDIPTGLGKTSVIAIWLLALARHAGAGTTAAFPRRLVYVVNRRTVVDQATREAEQMRQAVSTKPELRAVADVLCSLGIGLSDDPLAISTLRGQFADNADWRNDPARPAVIVGTVDMVGSRLLFAGYSCDYTPASSARTRCWCMTRPTWSQHSRNSSPQSQRSSSNAASSARSRLRRCQSAFATALATCAMNDRQEGRIHP